MYKTRQATKEDKEQILELCLLASYEANEDLYLEGAEKTVIYAIEYGFANVIEKDNVVVGVLLGHKTGHPFFITGIVAHELVWYVHENHRGSTHSVRLVKEFIKWAEKEGCKRIIMTSFLSVHFDKCNGILQKLQFSPREMTFEREL